MSILKLGTLMKIIKKEFVRRIEKQLRKKNLNKNILSVGKLCIQL